MIDEIMESFSTYDGEIADVAYLLGYIFIWIYRMTVE